MDERIAQYLSWVGDLQQENRQKFEEELIQLLELRGLSEKEFVEILEFLEDWKATAEVDSNPELREQLLAQARAPDNEFEEL